MFQDSCVNVTWFVAHCSFGRTYGECCGCFSRYTQTLQYSHTNFRQSHENHLTPRTMPVNAYSSYHSLHITVDTNHRSLKIYLQFVWNMEKITGIFTIEQRALSETSIYIQRYWLKHTPWGSHYFAILSLLSLFTTIITTADFRYFIFYHSWTFQVAEAASNDLSILIPHTHSLCPVAIF